MWPDYAALWVRLLQETARPAQLSKSQIPAALSAWHQWVKQQALCHLTAHQMELSHGPHQCVRTFDRAVIVR